jgi:hypothetical protein
VSARAAWAALIGTIVVAPLDEARAHPFPLPFVSFKSEPVAPFDKMGLSENILVIGPPPNKNWRFRAPWVQGPVDEYGRFGYINDSTSLYSFWRDEQRLVDSSINVLWRYRPHRAAPIDSNGHPSCRGIPAIFPSWLDGEARDEEARVRSISFGQVLNLNFAVECGSEFVIEPIKKNEGTFCCFQSLFAGHVQMISSNPEADSRKGKDYCETGNKFMLVHPQKMKEICEDADERATEKGAVIFFTAVFGCALVYWLARRHPRNRALKKQPSRQKQYDSTRN